MTQPIEVSTIHLQPTQHGSIDLMANFLIVGSIFQVLPPLAAILSIIWFILCIWESRTVQKFWDRWKGIPVVVVPPIAVVVAPTIVTPQDAPKP